MSDKIILFSGLPNSGKTTFIAALWYYLFYSSGNTEYTFDTLENSEQEYLNAISLKWASCEDVVRTNPTRLEDISIRIKNNSSNERMLLNVPDINGERFNSQFEFRQWEEDFENVIDNCHGLLLFVDPRDAKNKPRLIYHENQYYRMFGDDKPKNEAPVTEWTEKLAPSQVKLVDFLQMLDYHKPGTIKRIAIIISCWDVVKNETDPQHWAKTHVPLLYQYLTANHGLFEIKFFGISSQGGNYENDKAKLQQMEPLDRIQVTDGVTKSNNILGPILWLTDEH